MWIEELKNGKFKYSERYKKDGRWRKVSLTHTKHNNRVEKEMTLRLQEKINEKLEETIDTSITFEALIDEWLTIYELQNKKSTYQTMLVKTNALKKEFGNISLDELKANQLNRFIFNKTNTTSYATGKYYVSTIKRLLKYAVQQDYLSTDTLSEKLVLPEININKKNDLKYLEMDELKHVLDHFKNKNIFYHNAFKIIVNTGLRFGELAALEFKDIDFNDNSIRINKRYYGYPKNIDLPKNGKERTIYFNDDLKDTLKEQIKLSKFKQLKTNNRNNLLFSTSFGNPLNIATVNRALKKVKLPSGKDLSTHYFRHTYITMMVQKGVERRYIAEQVGHSDTKMIDQVYSHFTQTMQKKQKEMQLKHSII